MSKKLWCKHFYEKNFSLHASCFWWKLYKLSVFFKDKRNNLKRILPAEKAQSCPTERSENKNRVTWLFNATDTRFGNRVVIYELPIYRWHISIIKGFTSNYDIRINTNNDFQISCCQSSSWERPCRNYCEILLIHSKTILIFYEQTIIIQDLKKVTR